MKVAKSELLLAKYEQGGGLDPNQCEAYYLAVD